MKRTIMQITDYCIKGLEKHVGYRVGIDDLSIMNEVDELDVCEIVMDIEKKHGITFSQDITYIYDSVTQFIETLYKAQEE
jgi:acyl carrier protein